MSTYMLDWRHLSNPRRTIATCRYKRDLLGNVDVVVQHTYIGAEAVPPRAGVHELVEALLIHHLDRVPAPELVSTVVAAIGLQLRIDVDDLDRVLAHGVTQQLFDSGGTT